MSYSYTHVTLPTVSLMMLSASFGLMVHLIIIMCSVGESSPEKLRNRIHAINLNQILMAILL
jgi:hypothetical protein